MPVRMTKKGRAETREDKRSEQANQQAMSAQAASSPSEGKGSKKAKEPKSPTERKNEKKAQIREARMTSTAKRYGERYTPGMLSGGQVKLDKNKDGKISGEDFKMMKRKREGVTRKNPNSPKGQNPISEYDKKGKLKYTAANQGGMMAKSTRGYGAARTSGMGLQDEQDKDGKVQKAFLGIMAMKKAKKKGAKGAEFLSPALLAKRILGKKTGGPISGPKGGLPRMSDIDKDKIGKLKQQLNRFRNTPTKGGGADESKRMSDKTKQSIKKLVERIGRLTPAAKIGSDAGKIIRERLKKKIMTPAKKMGGGMMMKQYNKGGSVTASCKLGTKQQNFISCYSAMGRLKG